MTFRRGFFLAITLICFGFFTTACSSDKAANSCSADADCSLGTVCSVDKTCITASCEFCTDDQICYKATADDPGSCSAPECLTDADCEGATCTAGLCSGGGCSNDSDCNAGEKCNLAGTCVPDEDDGECTENIDCSADDYCNADGECVAGCRDNDGCPEGQVCGNGECACGAGTCPDGKVCLDSGNCGDPTDCTQVICDPAIEVCDPGTLACVARCTVDSCNANEACNMQTGFCEVTNCPNEDPTQCMGDPQRPIWDPIKCFCAECVSDADCDAAAGETCNAGGQCFVCQETCNPQIPAGQCSAATPYCINDCCVECVGAADCQAGEICLDGTCSPPPNCQVDPTICPAGYTCNMASGQCEPPNNNACDPNNPASCPNGGFCDPASMTCTNPFGGGDCGLCPGSVVNNVCMDACPGGCGDVLGGLIKACECDIIQQNCPPNHTCFGLPNGYCLPN